MKERDARFHIAIVVADDSRDDCLLVREALLAEKLADTVDFASDGQELMEYLKSTAAPDLIILDLHMPIKDGRQALKEIKGDERLRKIPVAILSGSGADEDRRFAEEHDVVAFLLKPNTLPGLFKTVRTLRDKVVS